jgi:hypothetical protein
LKPTGITTGDNPAQAATLTQLQIDQRLLVKNFLPTDVSAPQQVTIRGAAFKLAEEKE